MTPAAAPRITTRTASPADAALLATLGAATFRDTFAVDNTPEDMALYLAEAFGESAQGAELADEANVVLIAEDEGEAVGYAMLRLGAAPSGVAGRDAIEIARLYAVERMIGAGVGAALMRRCLHEAAARGNDVIWLGVWERNARAIAFYTRWGFEDVGRQSFVLGHDHQTDRVMARRVLEG